MLENISKSYGEKQLFSHVNLALPDEGRFCFYGPSGYGKTTLLRLIAGLEEPSSGRIYRKPGLKFSIHFQDNRLLPWKTVKKNLMLFQRDTEKVQYYLMRADLAETANHYPDELSGGMQRRLSLIRALMDEGEVLMLDEPLRELDAETAKRMMELVDESARKRLLLLVTHNRAEAEALGCRILEAGADGFCERKVENAGQT